MHVCVLGGGVSGITTAYYLAREGHRVTVLERHGEAAAETSHANGGQLSYSYVAPLAEPGVLRKLPGWLMSPTAPMRFMPQFSLAQWRWCAAFLTACTAEQSRRTTIDLLGLGAYSKSLLDTLIADEALAFDFRRSGKLVLYRDPKAFAGAQRQMALQSAYGTQQQALDAASCVAHEPALDSLRHRIVGGIYTASEETADCAKFTQALASVASGLGVDIHYHTRITGFRTEGRDATRTAAATAATAATPAIAAVVTDAGEVSADAFVVALGNDSPRLLRPLGISVPIYPLKGYSLTLPIREGDHAPSISVTDLHHKIVYARLGNALRIAGMVDLTPPHAARDARRIALLARQARETLPNAGDYDAALSWTGCRPATPDSKPILGASAFRNLWLNIGHGSLGFTFACASGKLIADLISGAPPALSLTPYQMPHNK